MELQVSEDKKQLIKDFLNLDYQQKYEKLKDMFNIIKTEDENFVKIKNLLNQWTQLNDKILSEIYITIIAYIELIQQGKKQKAQELLDKSTKLLEEIKQKEQLDREQEKSELDQMLEKIENL